MCIGEGAHEPAGWYSTHPVWSHRRHGTPLDIPLLHRPKTAPDGRGLGEFGTPSQMKRGWDMSRYEDIEGLFWQGAVITRCEGSYIFWLLTNRNAHQLENSVEALALQVVVKMLLQPETCWNKCCHHGTYSVWISLLLTSSICLSVIAWFGIKRGSQVDTNITPSINVHYSHCSKDPSLTKQKQHIGTFTYNHEIIYFAEYNPADWIWLVVSSHPNDMLAIRGHHISLS